MNRLKFTDGKVIKSHHELPIHKEIHPDRFMLENKEEVQKLRKKVQTLRNKIKYLEECRDRYKNYNGSGIQITEALEQTFNLLSNLGKETAPKTDLEQSDMADVQTFLPQNQNISAADQQTLAQLSKKIEEMKNNTVKQVEQLETQIKAQ